MKHLLLLLAAALISACASQRGNEQINFETVTYTPADWPVPLLADVWRPFAGTGTAAPAMLMVHGGGWERRSRKDMNRLSRYYAERGFVVMNISYRFAPEHRFPAQLHDLQQAMHWLHQHATELGIDRDRVAAFGYSAGAHLVSLLALTAGTSDELDRPYGGDTTRPAAVIAGGSPMDLRKYPGGKLVPQFLGGRIDEVPEIFAAASPVTHVHAAAPPFFLFHGGRDRLVTIDHAEEFMAALTALDVPVELYRQRGRGHVLAFLTLGGALEQADRFLDQTLSD
ncbi:MAG: alpha/beta hydrolase fold domain-containing protein [Alcanivoracaceae bacterium]